MALVDEDSDTEAEEAALRTSVSCKKTWVRDGLFDSFRDGGGLVCTGDVTCGTVTASKLGALGLRRCAIVAHSPAS